MCQLKTIKFVFTSILVLCICNKSANSILSENTPKEYNLTPVYKKQTFSKKTASEKEILNQKPQQGQKVIKPKIVKDKNKIVKQEDYRTEITVTSKRTKIEPVLQEEQYNLFPEKVSRLKIISFSLFIELKKYNFSDFLR